MTKKLIYTLMIVCFFMVNTINAQAPDSPTAAHRGTSSGAPLPPGHGGDDDVPAPVGGGLLILAALAAGYGAKKFYQNKKE